MNSLITREHNGAAFTFREDGYFNITKAAQHFGKEGKAFLRLASTRAYIEEMSKVRFPHLLEVTRGRNGSIWARPKLAVFFARWLDVRFAVWCDMQIEETPSGGHLARMQG